MKTQELETIEDKIKRARRFQDALEDHLELEEKGCAKIRATLENALLEAEKDLERALVAQGADKIHHLTMTGRYAGTPYCGIDRTAASARHIFTHAPYAPLKTWKFKASLCPQCKAVWLGDDNEA